MLVTLEEENTVVFRLRSQNLHGKGNTFGRRHQTENRLKAKKNRKEANTGGASFKTLHAVCTVVRITGRDFSVLG